MDKENGFVFKDDWDSLLALALVTGVFSDKGTDEVQELLNEQKAPITLKSLEKRVKVTSNAILELLVMQQKTMLQLETKIETIKKSLKR